LPSTPLGPASAIGSRVKTLPTRYFRGTFGKGFFQGSPGIAKRFRRFTPNFLRNPGRRNNFSPTGKAEKTYGQGECCTIISASPSRILRGVGPQGEGNVAGTPRKKRSPVPYSVRLEFSQAKAGRTISASRGHDQASGEKVSGVFGTLRPVRGPASL